MSKRILLCILDGWGLSKNIQKNAIHIAKTKNYDFLSKKFGSIPLNASENCVGLPAGQFGNSEVGHTNIGAGRIILQDIMRISKSFKNNEIRKKAIIKDVIDNCNRIHVVGLLSDGGVHGHMDHLFDLIDIINKKKPEIFIHALLDGRDSSPVSGIDNLKALLSRIKTRKNIKIASLSGRFFALDRDNRWERIKKAYKAIIEGGANCKTDPISELKKSYKNHITDEFFEPTNFSNYKGANHNDGFFITNYRADRVRELLSAIFDDNFEFFKRRKRPIFFNPVSMVEYSKRLRKKIKPLFENIEINNTLGEIISSNRMKQLRVAETEKYAHVTYFFNGGIEDKFYGEDRVLIPSPRVLTYDQRPEMSAHEVKVEVIKNLKKKKYDLIVTNFANPDMVGHTGNLDATVNAVEFVDKCIGDLYNECKKKDYLLILTSDHGNADKMYDEKKKIVCTTHTINPVPFIVCEKVKHIKKRGKLADIAPTVLKILKLKIPSEMDGNPLVE